MNAFSLTCVYRWMRVACHGGAINFTLDVVVKSIDESFVSICCGKMVRNALFFLRLFEIRKSRWQLETPYIHLVDMLFNNSAFAATRRCFRKKELEFKYKHVIVLENASDFVCFLPPHAAIMLIYLCFHCCYHITNLSALIRKFCVSYSR